MQSGDDGWSDLVTNRERVELLGRDREIPTIWRFERCIRVRTWNCT